MRKRSWHRVARPEDDDLDRVALQHCHRFVVRQARQSLNLSAAVYTVLYDRTLKAGVS